MYLPYYVLGKFYFRDCVFNEFAKLHFFLRLKKIAVSYCLSVLLGTFVSIY